MQVSEDEVFERVCQALGFRNNVGFLENESDASSIRQKFILQEAKEKIGIDAIYLIQTAPNSLPIPVIYFKKLKSIDLNEIRKLHRRIWNQGRTPLLFVISAAEIRVYNCFEPPPQTSFEDIDGGNRLISKLTEVATEEEIRQNLGDYSREKIDMGGFLDRYEDQFNAENRADQHLLRNLRTLRQELLDGGLHYKFVHSLIGRSIFVLYLEDRRALDNFFMTFENGLYKSFTEVLRNKEHTYALFGLIGKHFNGDMFPVTEEERGSVTPQHLSRLRAFLRGVDLKNGQERLWPYSFDIIPIEFISSVYEEFFHFEKAGTKAQEATTHYTPLFLVEFLLDQVLPIDNDGRATILDPSCGSGIFLVAAFRRLITGRIVEKNEHLNVEELKEILNNNIFGTDVNGEAIRVAAFSLYLTMLDYLEPKSLWQHEGLFPPLIDNNLFQKDFFALADSLKDRRFDIIIGNTPWESGALTPKAIRYCELRRKAVGDKQIAQAFLWKALEFAKSNSIICLIVTAKGLLFNRSGPNRRFRKQFFESTHTCAIINLSAMRHDIFENAVGPAAAVIYSPARLQDQTDILYVVPKPSVETRKLGAIVVSHPDVKRIPRDVAITDDVIWKSAMWGTPRDWQLLKKLRLHSTLRRYLTKSGWSIGDGFQINGGDKNERKWMTDIKFLPVNALHKYTIPINLKKCEWAIFHRPRNRKRYSAPLCLIKAAPRRGEIVAAFADEDICYDSNIIGISGNKEDEWALKIVAAFLNSSLARYFLFLTCSKWGVERDDILVDEYLDLPLVIPDKESDFAKTIISLHDQLVKLAGTGNQDFELWQLTLDEIDRCFFSLYELADVEKDLIKDTVKYTLDFFQNKENSVACKPANSMLLVDYAERVQGVINMMLGDRESIAGTIYTGSKNLVVTSFELKSGKNKSEMHVINTPLQLAEVLQKLRRLMTEKVSDKVYFARILKIYGGSTIYFVKPNEARYWTSAASYEDADDTIAEILESWSGQQ
ncbi:SAM-dependent methyltransferase [Candidatus Bathyarchaeota archaeon]|nr:SAM-dependent methyltransferase [Candidatus Bathyarchaeota archaeon]